MSRLSQHCRNDDKLTGLRQREIVRSNRRRQRQQDEIACCAGWRIKIASRAPLPSSVCELPATAAPIAIIPAHLRHSHRRGAVSGLPLSHMVACQALHACPSAQRLLRTRSGGQLAAGGSRQLAAAAARRAAPRRAAAPAPMAIFAPLTRLFGGGAGATSLADAKAEVRRRAGACGGACSLQLAACCTPAVCHLPSLSQSTPLRSP